MEQELCNAVGNKLYEDWLEAQLIDSEEAFEMSVMELEYMIWDFERDRLDQVRETVAMVHQWVASGAGIPRELSEEEEENDKESEPVYAGPGRPKEKDEESEEELEPVYKKLRRPEGDRKPAANWMH